MSHIDRNGAQPGPWARQEAWARAWAEMKAVLFRAIQGWRQFPGAVQIAPLSVGPLFITCRIQAFAEPVAELGSTGSRFPAVEWKANYHTATRSEVVELIAQQIRAGHLPNHGGKNT